MKVRLFTSAALLAGVLALGLPNGPASAQPRGNRNFGGNVRVYTPQVNVYNRQFNVNPTYLVPFGGYSGYVPPTTYSAFASRNIFITWAISKLFIEILLYLARIFRICPSLACMASATSLKSRTFSSEDIPVPLERLWGSDCGT